MSAPGNVDSLESPVSAVSAARRIALGDLTSEALVGACLRRIEAREPVVRAWAHLDADLALAQARQRDAEEPRSPLHGVPIGIKDTFDTADLPTECGTPIYAGRRPDTDAPSVSRLREAGLVILGKTVSTEFACFHPGPTTNPHDPTRTPGGSSSGSAAAVGAGMVPLALGSQTVGSTLRPAAFCGTWALKATHGWLTLDGVKPLSAPLDTMGLFAANTNDLAMLTSVLGGYAFDEPAVLRDPPRLAVVRTPWWDRADPTTRRAVESAAEIFAGSGAEVEELTPPMELDRLLDAHWTIFLYDLASTFRPEYEEHQDELSDRLREMIEEGQRLNRAVYSRALDLQRQGQSRIDEVLAERDALLTPLAVGEAPIGLDSTGDPIFNRLWTLLGTPAVAAPSGHGPNGMPVGVQLIGQRHGDRDLLAIAAWAENAFNESERWEKTEA